MSQYTSYYLYQKFEKRGDQDWLPVYPNVYSADGDGTMTPVIKQEDDSACGYTPPAQYRWVNLDPATDYYCEDCGTDGVKVSGRYGESGESFSVNCDSSTTLTSADTSSYSGITYVKIGDCVSVIDNSALRGRGSLTGVSFPSTITSIGNYAFMYDGGLIGCVIPESVTSIGIMAFYNCISLNSLILWDTITSIGSSAFTNCDNISFINIPTGLTNIPDSCFSDCGALSEVTIPAGVTSIGSNAFNNCSGLVSIKVLPLTPPTLGSSVFYNTNNCTIYVPLSSLSAYQSAWSEYSSRLEGIIF